MKLASLIAVAIISLTLFSQVSQASELQTLQDSQLQVESIKSFFTNLIETIKTYYIVIKNFDVVAFAQLIGSLALTFYFLGYKMVVGITCPLILNMFYKFLFKNADVANYDMKTACKAGFDDALSVYFPNQ